MVECDLAKVDAVGSNPIRRSNFLLGITKGETNDEDHGLFE